MPRWTAKGTARRCRPFRATYPRLPRTSAPTWASRSPKSNASSSRGDACATRYAHAHTRPAAAQGSAVGRSGASARSREALAPFIPAEAIAMTCSRSCHCASLGGACRVLQSSEVTSSRLVHSSERIVGSFCTRRPRALLACDTPSQIRAHARRPLARRSERRTQRSAARTSPGGRLHAWPSWTVGAARCAQACRTPPTRRTRSSSAGEIGCPAALCRSVGAPWARQGKARQGKAGFCGLGPAQMWACGRQAGREGSVRSDRL